MAPEKGKVMTVCGPVAPESLGRVMMHEHLYADCYDWGTETLIEDEAPITEERREMLMTEAVPYLKACTEHGCYAYCDTTAPPWRAWPTFYQEVTAVSGMQIVICTGCYCEMNDNEYWVKKPADRMWSFVPNSPAEVIAEYFTREIAEGVHGTDVHAGAIKLGSRRAELSANERKAFEAGVRAQKATGVPITTHAGNALTWAQIDFFAQSGVDLSRVIIGHTAGNLMEPESLARCMDWMREGVNFLPTNLGVHSDDDETWRPLVDAFHTVFAAGLGDKITIGLDWAFLSESGPFGPCSFIPPPPYLHMFTHTLPALRRMGLTEEEEDAITRTNPQNVLMVQ